MVKQPKQWKSVLVKEAQQNWQLYLLILPCVVYLLIFNYIPMYGAQIAFRKFSPGLGIWGSPWIGFNNFTRFFNSFSSRRIIWNTIYLSLLSILLSFPLPVVLALLLNQMRSQRYKKMIQTITYAPHFISIVVMVGMLNILLSPTTGLVNQIIQALGGSPQLFMGEQRWFRTVYILAEIWQGTGWGMILYLATLSNVDPALYEASRIDGANKWQQILHIDVPRLAEVVVVLLILRMGRIMSSDFEKVFLMQSSMNLEVSELISTYVYKIGMLQADYSYSAAVGLFNSAANCVLLVLVNAVSKRASGTSLF